MKIIVLEGRGNVGKTSTLNILYYDIIAEGAIMSNRLPLGGDANDFESVGDFNGEKIAIYTMGDFSSTLRTAIYKYSALGVDILICAINTNSTMVWANSAINHFSHVRHPKTTTAIISTRSAVNRADASILFSLI